MNRKAAILLLVLCPAGLAFAVHLYATRWGAGMSPDSVIYVQTARRLAMGEGLTIVVAPGVVAPITKYPPGYPVLLAAGPRIFGIEVVPFSRYLGAVMLAAVVAITTAMVFATTRSLLATLIGGTLSAVAPDQLEAGSYALSESPYIVFQLLAVCALARFLAGRAVHWFALAVLLTSACCMTRYIGHVLIPVGAVSIALFMRDMSLRKRILCSAAYSALALVPSVVLILRNRAVGDRTGTGTYREFGWHPITGRHLQDLLNALAGWMLKWGGSRPINNDLTRVANATVLIGLVVLGLFLRSRVQLKGCINERAGRVGTMLLKCLVALAMAYLPALLVSISTIDARTPLDFRLLSPLYPIAVVAFAVLAVAGWRVGADLNCRFNGRFARWMRAGLLALLALIGWSYVDRSVAWASTNHQSGYRLCYHARMWHESSLNAAVRTLPSRTLIWTNVTNLVYLHTGRFAHKLPPQILPDGSGPSGRYRTEMADVRARLSKHGGVIVCYWRNIPHTSASPDQLARELPETIRFDFDEGALLVTPDVLAQLQPPLDLAMEKKHRRVAVHVAR